MQIGSMRRENVRPGTLLIAFRAAAAASGSAGNPSLCQSTMGDAKLVKQLSGGVAKLVKQLSGSLSGSGPELDLSGSWLCIDVEGDMGAVLEQLGVPWLMRKIAKATGYGKGKLTNTIQHAHAFSLIEKWPGLYTSVYSELKLDGTENHIKNVDGSPMTNRLTIESVEDAAGQKGVVHRSMHTVKGASEEMRITRYIRAGQPVDRGSIGHRSSPQLASGGKLSMARATLLCHVIIVAILPCFLS